MSWLKILSRWGLVAGLTLFVAGAALVLIQVQRLQPGQRTNAIQYVNFMVTVLGIMITVVSRVAKVLIPASPPPVNELLRQLAAASHKQWTDAANDRQLRRPAALPIRWRRTRMAVAGQVSAAMRGPFDPLPGLPTVSDSALQEGNQNALHQVYGGLPSGRMMLIGQPGSGKSSAAILLLLDTLRYREQAKSEDQNRVPVPVLFTLHGWNPDSGQSVTDWIAGKLAETYPMFRGLAGRREAQALLAAGRLAVFLDGLDEIPQRLRPGVLAALANAPFRLVLLTRIAEAIEAASHGPLIGAIALELQPVQLTHASDYLLQPLVTPPPASWQAISNHLTAIADGRGQASAVSEALSTPLTLSLLRDVYGPEGPVDELLDTTRFPTVDDIENHLLDQAINAAYTPRPGNPRPRYNVETAQRTLRYLATQLTEHGTRDLAWWHIPTWISNHRLRVPLPFGLWLEFGHPYGFRLGRKFMRRTPSIPTQIRPTYRRGLRGLVTVGLAGGVLFGVAGGLGGGLGFGVEGVLVGGLVGGLFGGLVFGFVGGLAFGLTSNTDVDGSSLGPADVWRHDRNAWLLVWFLSMLPLGLLSGLLLGFLGWMHRTSVDSGLGGLAAGLSGGLTGLLAGEFVGWIVFVFVMWFGGPGSAYIETALAAVTLRRECPMRLIAFLEDARSRHLLRTVGPVYQFRHATLQDRLAQSTTPQANSGSSSEIMH